MTRCCYARRAWSRRRAGSGCTRRRERPGVRPRRRPRRPRPRPGAGDAVHARRVSAQRTCAVPRPSHTPANAIESSPLSRVPSVRRGPMRRTDDRRAAAGGARERLAGEAVGWLTTVGAEGQPQSSPVWFIWDGASLWLRSQSHAGKVRNVEANPHVAFHLADDGNGGNIISIEGAASLDAGPPELTEAYLAKYDEAIRAMQMSPEQLAADYSTTIRIAPTRCQGLVISPSLGWPGRASSDHDAVLLNRVRRRGGDRSRSSGQPRLPIHDHAADRRGRPS